MTTAAELDAADELAEFAREFARPPGVAYLDGNSLGLMCHAAERGLMRAVEAWRTRAVQGWTDGPDPWFGLSRRAAGLLAPLLGADPDDVMVGQSTTINLHQLLATFHGPGTRPKVVIDATHFPSDRYAVDSHLRGRGLDPVAEVVLVPAGPDRLLGEDAIIEAMGAAVGFAVLPAVVFTTGQLLDLPRLTAAARERDIPVAWDCSHSAGVVPHEFRRDGIDLAFGCGYKHLNGGPGAPGWLYVAPRLRDRLPGLAGWFGSDPARQFAMTADFHPAADAGRFQAGTPHVLSLAPLAGALELIQAAGIERIRAKSLAQTAFMRRLVVERLARFGVGVVTPVEDERCGGHLTLAHSAAGRLSRALRARGVVPDFRPPDLLRLAPAPLYTSFAECVAAIDILETLLSTDLPDDPASADAPVT